MFGIKTYLEKQIHKLIYPSFISNKSFPISSINSIQYYFLLFDIEKKLKNNNTQLFTFKFNHSAINTWRKLIPYMANNLGNWSTPELKPNNITTKLEKEVVEKMVNLYKADNQNLEGYITSGGTEGNIFSVWIGRKYLEQYMPKENMCLMRNDLTHYSVRKAADIAGIKDTIIPIDEKTWNTSVSGLEKLIQQLWKEGSRGFIIPLTLGYTVGGTNDDIDEIIVLTRKLKRKFKNIYFFFFIDAAFSGFTLPFTEKNFQPFRFREIQTFIVDFHKIAGVPYPASLILYRQNLRKLIEKEIPYLKQKDNTLLGSRSGIAAAACWITIHTYGSYGFKKEVENCIKRKNDFLKLIKSKFLGIDIKTENNSLIAAILSQNPLPQSFEQYYGIEPYNYQISFYNNQRNINKMCIIYKLFFLPRY